MPSCNVHLFARTPTTIFQDETFTFSHKSFYLLRFRMRYGKPFSPDIILECLIENIFVMKNMPILHRIEFFKLFEQPNHSNKRFAICTRAFLKIKSLILCEYTSIHKKAVKSINGCFYPPNRFLPPKCLHTLNKSL